MYVVGTSLAEYFAKPAVVYNIIYHETPPRPALACPTLKGNGAPSAKRHYRVVPPARHLGKYRVTHTHTAVLVHTKTLKPRVNLASTLVGFFDWPPPISSFSFSPGFISTHLSD